MIPDNHNNNNATSAPQRQPLFPGRLLRLFQWGLISVLVSSLYVTTRRSMVAEGLLKEQLLEQLHAQPPNRRSNYGRSLVEETNNHRSAGGGTKVGCPEPAATIPPTRAPTAPPTASNTKRPLVVNVDPLEAYLKQTKIISKPAKERVRAHRKTNPHQDPEPLRHLRFADLVLPRGTRNKITTAYMDATVVDQAPWFPRQQVCTETCCAQAVAVSMKQDETRVISALDGMDVADVHLYGMKPNNRHMFAASELTAEILPCLRPGVIIHADSYG